VLLSERVGRRKLSSVALSSVEHSCEEATMGACQALSARGACIGGEGRDRDMSRGDMGRVQVSGVELGLC
jgi:hypothetical protein